VPASKWVSDLNAAVADFSHTRRTKPVVRVTLPTGEARYLLHAQPSEQDELVVLDMYPEGEKPEDLLKLDGEAEYVSRQRLLVRPNAIIKVEILYEHPGRRGEFGFQVREASSSE
jgi:hypothetical protein